MTDFPLGKKLRPTETGIQDIIQKSKEFIWKQNIDNLDSVQKY
jgi:hypothetical protein